MIVGGDELRAGIGATSIEKPSSRASSRSAARSASSDAPEADHSKKRFSIAQARSTSASLPSNSIPASDSTSQRWN